MTLDQRAVTAARMRIAEACPSIGLGDVWLNVHGFSQATVVDLRPVDEDASGEYPWPMVTIESRSGSRQDWGAPAFIGCKRKRAGRGRRWHPPEPLAEISAKHRRILEKEARQLAREATARLRNAVERRTPAKKKTTKKKGKT